jgi:hypothetical protein
LVKFWGVSFNHDTLYALEHCRFWAWPQQGVLCSWRPKLLLLTAVSTVIGNSHMDVEELFSDYFEWKMATHPQAATYAGYHLHSDQLDDLSLDALLDVGIKCNQFQERALKILEWPQLHPRSGIIIFSI